MMRILSFAAVSYLFVVCFGSVVQAQVPTPTPPPRNLTSCVVNVFSTTANLLPANEKRSLYALPNGSKLQPGMKYIYTFNLYNSIGVRESIRTINFSLSGGKNTPLSILQVRSIAGPCTISSEKRVSCSISYSYAGTANEPIEILVMVDPSREENVLSSNFFIQSELGEASCFSNHSALASTMPEPSPGLLPAVTNLRVAGYRSVLGTTYKEAVLKWDTVDAATGYEIIRVGTEEQSMGRALFPTYIIRFYPDVLWTIALYPQDMYWNRGMRSENLTIAYPGEDTLPPVSEFSASPSPTPALLPTMTPLVLPAATSIPTSTPIVTPIAFDSSKIAILEKKVSDLEQTQQQHTKQIGFLESIISSLQMLFAKFFRTSK